MNIEAILEDLRRRPVDPEQTEAFQVLLHIMDDLREKCPWDKKQTFLSLRNLTIEEMYELADALLENNYDDVKEEIGDIMLHMVFYAKIADEEGRFNISDALLAICRKLIHRHPHIYGDTEVENEAEVKKNWEQLKLLEGKKSVLQGVPNGLPALVKAYRMQEKVAQVGFEWEHIDQVWEKVEEEIAELKEAVAEGDKDHVEHEFGDILFALVNYARFLKIDPETALEKVNKRFKSRFQYIENHATEALSNMTLEEMDVLWNEAKVQENLSKKQSGMTRIVLLFFLSLTYVGIFAQTKGFVCQQVHPSVKKITLLTDDKNFQNLYSDAVLLKEGAKCTDCAINSDSVYLPSRDLSIRSTKSGDGFLLSLKPNVEIYGGGGRALPVSRRGKSFPLSNNPWYGYGMGADHLNFSVPFFITSDGYGLFFDNPSKGYVDLGKKDPAVMEVTFTGGALSVFVIEGGSAEDILKNYHLLTGTQEMPPKWAFGLFMSRFGYRSESQVKEIAATMEQKGFPYDAIIFDLFWFGDSIRSTMGNLSWVNKNAWPNPEKMIRTFAKKDKKTILITEPYVLKTSLNFHAASPYFALDKTGQPYVLTDFYFGNGGLIDIFREDSQNWFLLKYDEQIKSGVAGWWGDLGEPERHPDDMYHQVFVSGKPEKVVAPHVHNLFGHEWTKMLYNHYKVKQPTYKLFNLNRAGFAGSQRYGIIPWTGDVNRTWDGFRAQIPLLTGMAMSGIPYIHSDAGGFAMGEKDPELYTRWYQFSVFSPILRPHGTAVYEVDPGAVSYPSEPALIGGTWEKILQKYTLLRYEMLPHNYHLAYCQFKYGEPLISPMVYYFPEDKNVSGSVDQYMWGKDILVAPVLEKNQKRKKLYLPGEHKWYAFQATNYKGKPGVYSGWQAWDVGDHDLPLFVREGAFIVLTSKKAGKSSKDFDDGNVDVHYYYSSKNSSSEWYDDEGNDRLAYQEGFYDLIGFSVIHEDSLSRFLLEYKHTTKGKWREKRKIKLYIHGLPQNKKVFLQAKMLKPDKNGGYSLRLTKNTLLQLEIL